MSAQRKLVKRLKAAGQSTLDAEQTLGTFVSALRHLEDHKRRIAKKRKAPGRELIKTKALPLVGKVFRSEQKL